MRSRVLGKGNGHFLAIEGSQWANHSAHVFFKQLILRYVLFEFSGCSIVSKLPSHGRHCWTTYVGHFPSSCVSLSLSLVPDPWDHTQNMVLKPLKMSFQGLLGQDSPLVGQSSGGQAGGLGMNWEVEIDMCALPYVKEIARGHVLSSTRAQLGAL